jgi:hypothetical protein
MTEEELETTESEEVGLLDVPMELGVWDSGRWKTLSRC